MKNINQDYRHDSLIWPEDLEVLDDVLYEPKLGELVARQAFDLKTNDPQWAKSISYDKEDGQGYATTGQSSYDGPAKIMHTMADDIPLIETGVSQTSQDVFNLAVGFRLAKDELEYSRATNTDIDTVKATKTRRILAELENNLAWYGNSDVNITGAFGAAGNSVDISGETGDWDGQSSDSGASIFKDLMTVKRKVDDNDGLEADTLVISPTIDGYFETTWMSSNYNRTVKEAVQNQFDTYLVTSTLVSPTDSGSAASGELLVMDSDATNVQLSLVMDRTREEPYQTSPYKSIVPFRERTAGPVVRFSNAIAVGYEVTGSS
jgi:hypothetical protein